MRFSAALIAVAAAASASAQTTAVPDYGSPLNMTIDPNSVDENLRATWCNAESNTCLTLCGNEVDDNDCTYEDLKYKCTCAANSSAPAIESYTQTMPTFICKELFSQCITQHANDQRGQEACTTNIDDLCATQAPPKEPVESDSGDDDDGDDSDASSTSTTASAPKATETEESVSTSTSDGLAAPTMAPVGQGAVAAAALGMMAYLI